MSIHVSTNFKLQNFNYSFFLFALELIAPTRFSAKPDFGSTFGNF